MKLPRTSTVSGRCAMRDTAMNDCPSCKSPDTIPYPWDDENDRFGVLREFTRSTV